MGKVYEDDTDEESGKDYGGSSGSGEYAPAPAASKPKVVTKEELAASGLSLRDYMNKQQGLTRRGESTPKAEPKATPKADTKASSSYASDVGSESKPAAKKETYRDLSGNVRTKGPDTSAEERAANRAKAVETAKSAASSVGDYVSSLGKREEKHGTYKKDGKIVRYAKGGSVSSASRRADGIATKGKTRGKIY